MNTTLMFIYTESSLHAGTGSSVSIVDLPIQRERATQYPIVQGSGVKGALRQQVHGSDDEITAVFGPTTEQSKNGIDHAGAISVGEAQVLLFPVRSLAGVFAYVTSPFAIARLVRDLTYAEIQPQWKIVQASDTALITTNSEVTVENSIVLEEFTFPVQANAEVTKLANWIADNAFRPKTPAYDFWRNKVRTSLVILSDDAFRDFVVNSTEIVTRIKLNSATKTVDKEKGALWTQEMLPADTLLYSTVIVHNARNGTINSQQIANWLKDPEHIPHHIQLGGDETTGAGMVALQWISK